MSCNGDYPSVDGGTKRKKTNERGLCVHVCAEVFGAGVIGLAKHSQKSPILGVLV